jgi:hypothetical protein
LVVFFHLLVIIDHVSVFFLHIRLAVLKRRFGLLLLPIIIEHLPQVNGGNFALRQGGPGQQGHQ